MCSSDLPSISENKAIEGLAGESKDYIVPAIISVGGAILSAASNDNFMKSAGFGVTAVGAAKIVNRVAGKTVVSLGSVNSARRMPRRIPQRSISGLGNTIAPLPAGMGRTFNQQGSALPGMSGQVGCF